MVGVCNAH